MEFEKIDKERLSITFTDDGRGIDASVDTRKLFDLGITNTSGSGLGLYQVREILDSMGASARFVRKKKGACLRLEFMR